ncbi:hypothetical protein [Dyella tabacisoli]|uniref:DUF2142 domain-containing protein n=1 Tax=Dyella tabacisoli TaxID=2282381 RepID=A0A369ULV3_9GAMM|nr:hypothetical protein [Dyella tabacisoli]RDD80580.1 hypothetical protein DVJ77_17045 [Dyella tabacisoli]
MRIAMVLFVVVGALIAWPESGAKILVPSDAWEVQGGFFPVEGDARDLRPSVVNNPQTRYWRSWSPGTGSQPGLLRTKPFVAKGTIVVPYNGFSGEPGISTYLECVDSGHRIYLAMGRTNTQWSEVFLNPPADFCAKDLRIVAETSSTQNYVAIGTPYEVSRLSAFKQSTLPTLWFLVLAWAVISGWFLALTQYASSKRWGIDPIAAGLIGLGLIGYIQFFVYWFSPHLGAVLSFLLVLLGVVWTGQYLSNRGVFSSSSPQITPGLRSAVGLWLLVAIALLALALIGDTGAGPWALNGRFTPARWSTDNQLPGFVARILVSGNHKDLGDFSQWTIADRPPLAYGWHATLHGVLQRLTKGNDGQHFFYLYQLATGVVLNTSWVALFGLLIPRLGLSRFKSLLVIAVATLCPFFIFNSLFIWPKLLSGTFTLMAAWMLLGMDRAAPPLRNDNRGLGAAAALCALGLLTHGGSAFGIIAVIGLTAFYRGMPSLKGGFAAAVVAIAIMLPWSLWQSHIQPPGNALVKFAFAGTFGFGEEKMGVLDTIIRSYHGLSLDAWLVKKRDGLLSLLFGIRNTCGLNEMGTSYSFIDRWRASDFYSVMPSLNFLLLGFGAVAIGKIRRPDDYILQSCVKLILFALVGIALSLVTTWDCYINHHQSYQALIALHLGLIVALLGAGRLGWAVLALNALYGFVVWGFEPLNHFPRFDYVAIMSLTICIAVWVRMLLASRRAELGPLR